MKLDRIKNDVIKDKVGVSPIEDKMREARLKWFGHIRSRSEDTPVKRCEKINLLRCKRGRVGQGRVRAR